jgi:preprotein translocase subunit SecG
MIYYLLKALENCDEAQPSGFRAMLGNKAMLKNVLIAGILFALIALSWNEFRIILLMLVFFMAAQAVADRLRSKEIMPAVCIYSGVILLGILISLPYYVVAGLWDLAFSGPFIVAIMSVALAVLFGKTANKTWVLMIPVIIIIAVVVLVVLYFVSGDLYSAVVSGNTVFENELMAKMTSASNVTSLSAMAAFFGWVTVWLPLVMFLYMLYKYRKHMDSKKYTFAMWWILAMFIIGWYSTAYAVLAGAGFAVASAALILMAIRMVGLKGYLADMRGNGIKISTKKVLKPIPLATLVVLVALVAAPNLVYAVDAGTPTNSEDGGYFGGLGYTIMTDDTNSISKMWNDLSDTEKEGALIAWFGHSTEAVSRGGFDLVTDGFGGGTSAMSSVLLANSSSAATAAMALRLLLSKDLSAYKSAIESVGLDYNKIKGYIDNPSDAVKEIKDNIEEYSGVDPSVTKDNALYFVLCKYITSTIPEPKVNELYNKIRSISGESINYVAVDVSMLPLYYSDGTYLPTIAYLGSYTLDRFGAPAQFFTYNTSTGYATYTDAMYSTFFWKALIGMSPSEAGYSSSINYLNALALSDGSVKSNPGYGLANYKIAYWHVYYNPDSSATASSDGWEAMDAFEAMEKQSKDGGLINYANGIVMLEYDPSITTGLSGKVTYSSASGTAGAKGIQVSVFVDAEAVYGTPEMTGYVKRSMAFTDASGSYTISVPKDADYYVVFSSGASPIATGSVIETRWKSAIESNANLSIATTSLSGSVYVNSDPFIPYTGKSYAVIEGTTSGERLEADIIGGDFTFNNILPDIYRFTVFSPTGTTINTGTVTVNVGANSGYRISATSGTITVTVTTDVGASAPNGTTVEAKDTTTGAKYTGVVEDGKAKISVVPSTYTIYATGTKVSISNPNSTVSSGGASTASLTVFDSKNISVSGAPSGSLVNLMSFGFVTSTTTSSFAVPISGGSSNEMYTAYAVSGNTVYYGTTTGSNISLTNTAGCSVKGVVKDSDGKALSGTVSFIKQDGLHTGATFVFTSNKDGGFDVTLPAGKYTMYIYGSSNALIKTITVNGGVNDLGNIKTSNSRDITLTLNYRTNMSTSTTRGIAFVDVALSLTIDEVDYKIVFKTDSAGRAVFSIPRGYAAKATTAGFDTAKFHLDAQSRDFSTGSNNTSDTWTLAISKETESTKYVKAVNVTSNLPVTITIYNSASTTYSGTSLTGVIPGQYTATVAASTGYYYNGTVYIYPGQTGPLNIQATATNVVTVTLLASEDDRITVTPTDDEKGSYFVDPKDPLKYYLQRNKSFYFKAVSSVNGVEQIAYASVKNISSSATLKLDAKAEKAVIDGYAGVKAAGTLTATYGSVSIPFVITDGTFEMTLPTGIPLGTKLQLSAVMTQILNNKEYTYIGSAEMSVSEVVDGAMIRFHATTSSTTSTLDLTGSNFNFANGNGSFTLSIKNTGSYAATYTVTAGSAWVLDKAYSLTVNAGQTGTIAISGRYNPDLVGAGNENLSVTVRSINGTSVGTYVVDGSVFSSPDPSNAITKVNLTGTEGAYADAVNGYEYMYAVTFTNDDNYLKTLSISVNTGSLPPKWSLVFTDKDGGMVTGTSTFTFGAKGYGSTVVYIKLLCKDGSETNVPAIDVTVTVQQGRLETTTGKVTIDGTGKTANFNMSAQSSKMEPQDMYVDGDNIFNSSSPVPVLTLVLMALFLMGFIAMIWVGAKKGVVVRRR